jgi:carbon starvation protein
MVFMLIVTICSLIQTIMGKVKLFGTADADIWVYIQALLAALLVVLALVLAVYSFVNLAKQAKEKKAA